MPLPPARTLIVPVGVPPDDGDARAFDDVRRPVAERHARARGMVYVIAAVPDVTVTDMRAVKPDRRAMPSTKA